MNDHTITIDMDKPCPICGRKGQTTDNGICLKCALKRIKGGLIGMKIGEKTIQAGIDILQSLLWEKQGDMERAIILNGEDSLTVTLKLKITPDAAQNRVKGSISFAVEQSKGETDDVFVDENQLELGFKEEPTA
jgi:hypothetical protein